MSASASQAGVSASTIRRFGTADDAEADGVLALVAWLGNPPEQFIVGSTIEGTPLPPVGSGQIRVDLSRLDEPGTRSRIATRTTIQRLTAAATAAGCSIASLTRWSEV